MSTQIESAREGIITDELKTVAETENVDVNWLLDRVSKGLVCIPVNNAGRSMRISGIGEGLSTKVNANIGTSRDHHNIDEELEKAAAAINAGTDALMDLSTGGDIPKIRKNTLETCNVPIGTVPIYEAAAVSTQQHRGVTKMTVDAMFDAVRRQAREGVDFQTIHAGLRLSTIKHLQTQDRITGIVSRGGTFMAAWMLHNNQENPFYTHYDELLDICKEHDVALSLGDGLRPGCLADAGDRAQIDELLNLAELGERAVKHGVQVMLEGPGHVPLNQIETQMKMMKTITRNLPFYVLGPLVTDIAPGYDHITSAIGGALAAYVGADFLCYVTPSEHLRLPNVDDVRTGVITTRIAAHAADIAKGIPNARDWDDRFSQMRRDRDWEGMYNSCIDPERARAVRAEIAPTDDANCSMCGDLCVFNVMDELETT